MKSMTTIIKTNTRLFFSDHVPLLKIKNESRMVVLTVLGIRIKIGLLVID